MHHPINNNWPLYGYKLGNTLFVIMTFVLYNNNNNNTIVTSVSDFIHLCVRMYTTVSCDLTDEYMK